MLEPGKSSAINTEDMKAPGRSVVGLVGFI